MSTTPLTPINDGGPAFPCETYGFRNGKETTIPTNGMSLRDYFAGQALISEECNGFTKINDMVKHAYTMADAMIAAREVKP